MQVENKLHGCLQRVTIPDAVIIQFVLLKMSIVRSKYVEDYNVIYIYIYIVIE